MNITLGTTLNKLKPATKFFASALLGAALAIAAWGPDRSPAVAVMLPLLWIIMPTRSCAFALATAYHLAVVRFLGGYASVWFGSAVTGYLLWLAMGSLCGMVWAVCWPRKTTPLRIVISTLAALALTLASPVAAILPGHPIVGWGFLLPGVGWMGVALMFATTMAGAWALRIGLTTRWPKHSWTTPAAVGLGVAITALLGMQPGGDVGKVAGRIGAVSTRFGEPPPQFSLEVMTRIEKMGDATAKLAGGDDGLETVIYPEAIIGIYDPSLYPALNISLLRQSRPAGQTVVLGADMQFGPGRFQSAAMVFRPDGSEAYVNSRQSAPVSMWAPWSSERHYPLNWFADNTIDIGNGIKARVMFCYEEYIPILHLIDEAAFEHQLVVSMANLWPSEDPLASLIQGAHTQGMALLFNRRWVRSVNHPSQAKKL